jgi:multimeric flavodoxin WrbA
MKLVAIMASPRKRDGYGIMKLVEKRIKDSIEFAEIDYIWLNECNLFECRGCEMCFKKGEKNCPCIDDLESVKERLYDANGIIVVTPVYAYQVPSKLKLFIDRMSYWFHRQELVGIPTMLLVTSDGGGHSQVKKYMKMVISGWGLNYIDGIDIVAARFFTKDERRIESAWTHSEAYAIKKRKKLNSVIDVFIKEILSVNLKRPSFYDIFLFQCLRSKTFTSKLDYEYWQLKKWITADYFYDCELGFTKKVFSKFMKVIIDIASKKIESSHVS